MPGSRAIDVAPRQTTTLADAGDAPGSQARIRPNYDGLAASVNQNGCFDFDRVIKCGYVERRTQKTKKWKTIYMVLRPNALSMYKNEKETKLRHQVYLSDLTAVAFLKDPKHRRQHVFGVFSPSKNFHFQAPSAKDAQEWVELIRRDARIEQEEEEMFLAGPLARSPSPNGLTALGPGAPGRSGGLHDGRERVLSSSPEAYGPPERGFVAAPSRRPSSNVDSSAELPSHSDLSDSEGRRPPAGAGPEVGDSLPKETPGPAARPLANRSASQASVLNMEQDPDRIIWQGWLWMLRSKGGVRQWKDMWGVLRLRNLILYKDESEYTAQWIVQLSAVVDVVDMDPLSKSKENCLQIITEEKSYRFCAHDEESLVQFIGAFKSLLAKRRGLEARVAAAATAATT